MTTLWQVPAAVVALLAWLTMPPTSLADAARREAVRRAAIGAPAAVLSNQNLPPDWVVSPSSRPAPAQPEPAAAAEDASTVVDSPAPAPATPPEEASAATAPASGAAPADAKPAAPVASTSAPANATPAEGDEQAWRGQMSSLRAALAADQAKAAALQTRINGLQTDFVNRDDPGQKAVLERQLNQALADLDKARAQIQADTAAIQALRERARRAGVPAGWTR
jgi:hypothetical protein